MISHTALFIALKSYVISRQNFGSPLAKLPWNRLYSSISKMPFAYRLLYRLARFSWFRSLLLSIDDALFPGDVHHLLSRKAWVSEFLTCQKKPYHLVQIGSGLDLYSFLNDSRLLSAIELDLEAMLRLKPNLSQSERNKIQRIPWNAHTDPLPELVLQAKKEPIIVLTEGFLEYQELELIQNWIACFSNVSTEVHWISTFFDFANMNQRQVSRFTFWISSVGEKLRFPFNSESPAAVFSTFGFRLKASAGPEELEKLFDVPQHRFRPLAHFHMLHFVSSSKSERSSPSVQ